MGCAGWDRRKRVITPTKTKVGRRIQIEPNLSAMHAEADGTGTIVKLPSVRDMTRGDDSNPCSEGSEGSRAVTEGHEAGGEAETVRDDSDSPVPEGRDAIEAAL